MTAPQIYNDFAISVSPEELKAAGTDIAGASRTEIGGWLGEISTSLGRIINTLDQLKLGWAGKTAEEAKNFFDSWGVAMEKLFGSATHPEDGTLFLAATALRYSGNNYNATEDYVCALFAKLGETLSPKYDNSGELVQGGNLTNYVAPPQAWTTEWWQGAVAEVF